MTRQTRVWIVLAAGVLAAPALAQGDPMSMARSASANQIGVLEYCQAQGHVDASAVAAMRSVAARLPPAPGAAATDAAEVAGRQGSIVANGTTTTLASFADTTHTTVPALCKQLADGAARSAAAQAGGMGATPAMPAMPGGGACDARGHASHAVHERDAGNPRDAGYAALGPAQRRGRCRLYANIPIPRTA